MKQKIPLALILLLVFSVFVLNISFAFAQSDKDTLYVTVIEQVGDAARVLTDAKVALSYGSLGGEQSIPAEWQDISVDETGRVVFLNVQPGVYTIIAKAPSYISAKKEFSKQAGEAGYISVALTKVPEGATSSIRIALLKKYAPQTKEYIKNGQIEILKDGEVIRSAGTESGEILFSGLPIGTYIASASAPGYNSKQVEFEIEANVEGWLPIGLEEAGGKLRYTTCPKDCTCDNQTIPIECHGQGFGEKGVAVSTEDAIKIVKDKGVLEEVVDIELKEDGEKISYEISGTKQGRLLFFIPVQMSVKTNVDTKTGVNKNTQKPWWSFLVW